MTTLVVQQDKLLHNFHLFQKTVGKAAVIPVLAANAYGLGCVQVASILYQKGIRFFACGRLEDAVRVKKTFNDIEVLVLNTYSSEDEARELVANDLISSVGSYDSGVILSGMAQEMKKEVKIHLKFDTEMARMGFSFDEVQKAVQVAKFLPGIRVCGVYSNITSYECRHKKKPQQILKMFKNVLAQLQREEVDCGLVHLAGSAGALKYPSLRLGAVRCGGALVGDLKIKDKWGFKKVGRLVTSLSDLCWLPERHNVGVSNSYKTRKASKIAVVSTGYADGLGIGIITEPYRGSSTLPRLLRAFAITLKARKLFCDVNGKRARVVGRADSETFILDVTKISCKPGDIVSFEVNPMFIDNKIERTFV